MHGFHVYLHPPSDAAGDNWQLGSIPLTPMGGAEAGVSAGMNWAYLIHAPHTGLAANATLRTDGDGDSLTFLVRRLPLVMPGRWEIDGSFSSRETPHSLHLNWQISNEVPPLARQFHVYLLEGTLVKP